MAEWAKEELRKIAEVDDLHIAPFRDDGKTYGTPTWISSCLCWRRSVCARLQRNGVPRVSGRNAAEAGRIVAAGMTKEVAFESVNGSINDSIDDAYRAKYAGSPYLKPMIGTRAGAATVRIMPRDADGRLAE